MPRRGARSRSARCYPGSNQSRRWFCRRVVRPASTGRGLSNSSFATVATQRATFPLHTPITQKKRLQRSGVSACLQTPSAHPLRRLRREPKPHSTNGAPLRAARSGPRQPQIAVGRERHPPAKDGAHHSVRRSRPRRVAISVTFKPISSRLARSSAPSATDPAYGGEGLTSDVLRKYAGMGSTYPSRSRRTARQALECRA